MKVCLPDDLTPELAEESGLHAGDGSMNYYSGRGLYSLRGNKLTDLLFYEQFVLPLYASLYHCQPRLRFWREVMGFQICSSELVAFKEGLGLPLGPKKDLCVPDWVVENDLQTHFLRGFLETDGGVYLENKYGRPYPRISLSTTSPRLASGLKKAILQEGLTCSLWSREYSNGWKPIYRVCSRGLKNARLWLEKIGCNHPEQLRKLHFSLTSKPI